MNAMKNQADYWAFFETAGYVEFVTTGHSERRMISRALIIADCAEECPCETGTAIYFGIQEAMDAFRDKVDKRIYEAMEEAFSDYGIGE